MTIDELADIHIKLGGEYRVQCVGIPCRLCPLNDDDKHMNRQHTLCFTDLKKYIDDRNKIKKLKEILDLK